MPTYTCNICKINRGLCTTNLDNVHSCWTESGIPSLKRFKFPRLWQSHPDEKRVAAENFSMSCDKVACDMRESYTHIMEHAWICIPQKQWTHTHSGNVLAVWIYCSNIIMIHPLTKISALFESSLHADHNGTITSTSHSMYRYNVSLIRLGLGMKYDAGICTIVISMNGKSKWSMYVWMLMYRLNFDSLRSCVILAKMCPTLKNYFNNITWRFFSCWSQWHNPQLHIAFKCIDAVCLIKHWIGINPNASHVLW